MFFIQNDGPRLLDSDFWRSDMAQAGYLFVSWNDSCCRVLLPMTSAALITEMHSATEAVITRGPWPAQGREDALEILFEDGTDNPFVIQVVPEQCDRVIPAEYHGGRITLAVYTEEGIAIELPARFRVMPSIPCLEPWTR